MQNSQHNSSQCPKSQKRQRSQELQQQLQYSHDIKVSQTNQKEWNATIQLRQSSQSEQHERQGVEASTSTPLEGDLLIRIEGMHQTISLQDEKTTHAQPHKHPTRRDQQSSRTPYWPARQQKQTNTHVNTTKKTTKKRSRQRRQTDTATSKQGTITDPIFHKGKAHAH